MLRYVFKPIGFYFVSFLAVVILDTIYWSVYDNLSQTVKYDAVYYLEGVDTYLEINYDEKDSFAYVFLRQSDSATSKSHALLRVEKIGLDCKFYRPFHMLFYEKTCYFHSEQTEDLVSLASARPGDKSDVWNDRTFRFGSIDNLDSCKMQFYVSNQLQSAFVWNDGDMYGEYLEPVKKHKTTRLDDLLSKVFKSTN